MKAVEAVEYNFGKERLIACPWQFKNEYIISFMVYYL
jgi:hypothetical protein